MAGFSTYEADRILAETFRTQAVAVKRSNIYVALFAADPTTGGVEISGLGYARVAVPVSDTWWTAPALDGIYRFVANSQAITFGTPTGNWNSGALITYGAVFDAISTGNRLGSAQLPTARYVLLGDNPAQIPIGALRIRLAAAG